jgi:hypothetical protein
LADLVGHLRADCSTTSPTRDGKLVRAKYEQICYLGDPGDDGEDVISYSL